MSDRSDYIAAVNTKLTETVTIAKDKDIRINELAPRVVFKDELPTAGADEKVKVSSAGTSGFLQDVLDKGDFLTIDNDGELMIISGVKASSAQVKARSISAVIMTPSQMAQFSAVGRPMPALNDSEFGNGLEVKRIEQTSQELFQFGLDLKTLPSITTTDLSKMRFAVLDDTNNPTFVTGLLNGLGLQQIIGGLVGWTLAATPQIFHSNTPPFTSFISVHDPNGTKYGLSVGEFTVVEKSANITSVSFSDTGDVVTATLNPNSILVPFDSSGTEYGRATIKWTHPTIGGSMSFTLSLINSEPTGGSGLGTEMTVQLVTAWPATSSAIKGNCVLFLPGSGFRVYTYDAVNERYCHEDYAGANGLCLS